MIKAIKKGIQVEKSFLFISPIPQPQPLVLVSLNHFMMSMRKYNSVLGDALPCGGPSPSAGMSSSLDTCYLPAPYPAGNSKYVINSASL